MRLRVCVVLLLAIAVPACSRSSHASPEFVAHPDKAGAKVEYFEQHPVGTGPWPTVIFLHGHQDPPKRNGGRAFEDWGVLRQYAGKGYLAVSVSLPGYGGSDGPEDFAGPFTQDAVAAVIAKLISDHKAVPEKIVVEGISLGAVTAALLGEKDRRLAGLVLISGLYDLPEFFADPKTLGARQVKAAMQRQTGGSAPAMEIRSALPAASSIKAATLIINGAQDDRTDPEQAKRFAAAINAAGGNARVHIYPQAGHAIPVKAREVEVSSFIDTVLK